MESKSEGKESNEEELMFIPSLEVSYSMTRQGTNEHATPSPKQTCVYSYLAGLYSGPSDDEMSISLDTIPSKAPSVEPIPDEQAEEFVRVIMEKKKKKKKRKNQRRKW